MSSFEEKPEDGAGPKILKGTKPDRVVSTTDPEMRHGRKSHSKRFDGYKASVAAETESGVILSTDVIAGNAHDSEGAGDLVKHAGKAAKKEVERVLGDTAYGTTAARMAETLADATDIVESDLEHNLDAIEADDIHRMAETPSLINLVNLLLLEAIRGRSSDLHIEPF